MATLTNIFEQILGGDVGLGFFAVCCAAAGVGIGFTVYGLSLVLSGNEAEQKIGRRMLLSAGFQFAVVAVALMSGLWQMAGIVGLVVAYLFLWFRKKKEPIQSPEPMRAKGPHGSP